MMFGMTIILFRISSSTVFSSAESSSMRAPSLATSSRMRSASSRLDGSFLAMPISLPISLEILLRFARSASTSCLISRFLLSSSMTSSTRTSFLSWNFFLMFSLTSSGFSRTNFISSIFLFSFIYFYDYAAPHSQALCALLMQAVRDVSRETIYSSPNLAAACRAFISSLLSMM